MKNFSTETYVVDDNFQDTITWLLQHQDCFDELRFDVLTQELTVIHAAGTDIIRAGQFLNARYGILVTSL
ncbi:hypothetical protein [Acinetobacter sp. MD2]|uniref:hypothetical protein n=1 Tax=Acinetobacter sp. MD2 TaxID=2600066 RepID=UPI002D1F644C|nr:hypothetical protein [Acinetobacter sp. MD2]MEB3766382.1 hypothetical protein [Acinetobacter sp. MD2]